jgi:hypothetical protein
MNRLEASLAEDDGTDALAVALVVLAAAAGEPLPRDERVHGAARRAVLLLAAGGDPERGLDFNGRAVTALAEELDDPGLRSRLLGELAVLERAALGLPYVTEALHAMRAEPDVAWRAYACSILADELSD